MINHLLVAFIISLSVISSVFAAEPANPRNMTYPPLNFTIPKGERVVLENGTPVYLLQDHELPIVNITAMLHAGSLYDPAEKAGLASITGSQIRNGGSKKLAPAELDEQLEFMASSVVSYFGDSQGTVRMSSLTRNLDQTMQIFSDLIFTPRFDQQRLDVAKKQAIESIRRQNDDPKGLADRALQQAIFAGHPNGIIPTEQSISSITVRDMQDLHRRFVRADNMILTVSGDFDRQKMIAALNRLILPVRTRDRFLLPQLPEPKESGAEVIYGAKQVNQTVIRMGHLGIDKNDPDIYAARVLNYILGGGFTSRLVSEVRSNQGLAYHISSNFTVGNLFRGDFVIQTETKVESTAKTIGIINDIIGKIRREPVSEQELNLAREAIVNSFMFGFTTPDSVVAQQARLEFYNYRPDYLERYRDNIAAVTREDILRVAKRLLQPERMKLVVVGDSQKFDRPLTDFGNVTPLK